MIRPSLTSKEIQYRLLQGGGNNATMNLGDEQWERLAPVAIKRFALHAR